MKRLLTTIAMSGFIWVGAQALADDSASHPLTAAQKQQMMKDCMARKVTDESGMSKSDMKKACKEEMKAHEDPTINAASGGPNRP